MRSRNASTGRLAALMAMTVLLVAHPALAQSWPSVGSSPEGLADGSKDAAVLVGIGDYAFVPDVPGATTNVLDWYSFLRQSYGIPSTRIILLQNEQGTRENIVGALKKASKLAEPGGNLWFVFVGHGAASKDGKDGVLIGADTQGSATSIYARSVPRSEVLELAAAAKGVRPVVVIDACFSGQTESGASLVEGLQPLIPVDDKAVSAVTEGLVFSAGTSDQFAGPLPGVDRPAFSYLLLGALEGWADKNSDGEVSAAEAIDYTRDVMATKVTSRTQTPELQSSDAGAILSRGDLARAPDLDQGIASTGGAPAPGKRTGYDVRVFSSELPALDLQLASTDGRVFRCRTETPDFDACTLKGVPAGAAKMRLETSPDVIDVQVTGDLTLRAEQRMWTWPMIGSVTVIGTGAFVMLAGLTMALDDPADDPFWTGIKDKEEWKAEYEQAVSDFNDEVDTQRTLYTVGGTITAVGAALTIASYLYPDTVMVPEPHKVTSSSSGTQPPSWKVRPALVPTTAGAYGGVIGSF